MKQVYKYPLSFTGRQMVMMPPCREFLCVQVQRGTLCLWVLVRDDPQQEVRTPVDIIIHATGYGMPDNPGRYVGTFQLEDGAFVGHLFVEEH